ncbi:19620_t:CDS:1, partial [Dentiscutata erythropus]
LLAFRDKKTALQTKLNELESELTQRANLTQAEYEAELDNLEDQISQLTRDLNKEQEHLRLAREDIESLRVKLTIIR